MMLLLLLALLAAPAAAEPVTPAARRPAAGPARAVAPDHSLRRWDPVTVFFAQDVGPAKGGPEDPPERLVTLSPPHPGAFTWLDARTFQSRPAEPWPPLARFAWAARETKVRLTTLMAAPSNAIPPNDALGLERVEAITLTFAEPIDPADLARMVTIELRPLPGVGSGGARWMTAADFQGKALERHARADPATYVLELASPVPLGTRAVVHLRLSLDDDAAESFAQGAFATAQPFRVGELGCRGAGGPSGGPRPPAAAPGGRGRPREMRGEGGLGVSSPRQPSSLGWGAARGRVEGFGPQRVPLEGRGKERLDLRLHRLDPLDRAFWPFPARPVPVDESQRPPGPGEEPAPHTEVGPVSLAQLQRHIAALGSPPVSTLVGLPLRRDGKAASFGLDLGPHLAHVAGKERPGAYLVGLRRLDGSSDRSWMRVQVTDLSLTTLEEPDAVRFAVTSLATSRPVAGASVKVEGTREGEWVKLAEGRTGGDGTFRWPAPGWDAQQRIYRQVRRITVASADDLLVLDPLHAPDGYADNHWSATRETWLQWAFEPLAARTPPPEDLCHIYTERPVYRPDETVHVKGYLRRRERGTLSPLSFAGTVVIQGPGEQTWKRPVMLTPGGSFYTAFSETNLPTGDYSAHLEDAKKKPYGNVTFRIDAYRIPTFEVELHAPDKVPLDGEFQVALTSTYYAGGKVAGRPVAWRVTQFPYTWSPKQREGFEYSSDVRFSGTKRFESSGKLEKDDTTDENGAAQLSLDPAVEPTAQPRTYVVEATVTGPDDQTVTNTKHVIALPPFVLGLKVPRYLERATEVAPEVIVVGPDGSLQKGTEAKVRLLNRQWHSHLRASDFSNGVARYVTDVVDEKVSETTVTSGEKPTTLHLPLDHAGVYVVELEAHDRLGRAQVIGVDLYAGGAEPVTWAKPATRVFEVATDK